MDKRIVLQRLEELVNIREVAQGFKSREDCLSWVNKVAPLLKFEPRYYEVFYDGSLKLQLKLSGDLLESIFNTMKSQVIMAIEELKLQIGTEEAILEQMYFPENSHLDIQKNLAKVIRQAQNSLWISDAYMDEKIIEELSEIPAVEFQLLTLQPKGLFRQRLAAFKQQFLNKSIEVKKSDKFHDRFYIIDEEQIWTLGASFNKAGNKATLLSKVKSDTDKAKIIDDFNNWWKTAALL